MRDEEAGGGNVSEPFGAHAQAQVQILEIAAPIERRKQPDRRQRVMAQEQAEARAGRHVHRGSGLKRGGERVDPPGLVGHRRRGLVRARWETRQLARLESGDTVPISASP